MAKRNVYKIVEADTLVPTATEDICAWWYSRTNSTLWRFDEESEAWVQAIQGGGGSSYILPVATEKLLGGIKVGDGLQITSDGKLSLSEEAKPYTLPTATSSILGGIKVGGTLTMNNGVLNVKDTYTLKAATASVLGGMKIGYKEDRENNLYAVKLDTENRAYVEVHTGSGGLTEVPLATRNNVGGFLVSPTPVTGNGILYVQMLSSVGYAYVDMPEASSNFLGAIKLGYQSTNPNYVPVQIDNEYRAYVDISNSSGGGSTISNWSWEGLYGAPTSSVAVYSLGKFLYNDEEIHLSAPKYLVPDTKTGLTLNNFKFTLATANESTQGTVKTSEVWQLDQDTITDTMWNKWKDNWYYKTLKGYIKEGQIYFKQWLQHNLITSNKSNLQFVEDTGKINLNLTYTPYATIATPNPKSTTTYDKDVSDHLISLYKSKADLDQVTGWIRADQLPDGFYSAYILCEAQLDETGKGKIYEDIEDPQTELTPNTSALYFDTLTNTSYRYVNDIDGQHQFVEVSKELVYTGGDNVEITKERQIKVKKTTGIADTYVTEDEQVMPIRRLVQKYNNYLYGNLYEISTEPVEDRLYYGIPDGDEYVQKNRVYTWNATESKYIELTDNDGNVLFDNDTIIYISDQGTKYYLDILLQEGARGDSSYTVIAYQPIMWFYVIGGSYTDEQIQDIACITCKDFEEVKGQLYALEAGEKTQISMPVRDYHYYDYSSSIKPNLTYELVCYKWLRNGTNGSKEDRIYDTENYYKRSYRLIKVDNEKRLFDTFIYQRPQMEYYPTVETPDTGIEDAYTAVQVGNAIMTAEGKDSLNFVAGDNVELDIDFDSKAVKISATGGGAVTSVNTKTGDVVLTAEDVDAYTKTDIDEKTTEISDSIVVIENNVTNLGDRVTTVETDLENKQDKLTTDNTMSLSDNELSSNLFVYDNEAKVIELKEEEQKVNDFSIQAVDNVTSEVVDFKTNVILQKMDLIKEIYYEHKDYAIPTCKFVKINESTASKYLGAYYSLRASDSFIEREFYYSKTGNTAAVELQLGGTSFYTYYFDYKSKNPNFIDKHIYTTKGLQFAYSEIQSYDSSIREITAKDGTKYYVKRYVALDNIPTEEAIVKYINSLNIKSYSAGTNITISDAGEISATDTIYDDTDVKELIAANTTAIETEKTRAESVEETKQDKLTAGDNITIDGTTISATDTVYDDTTVKADIETLKTNKQNKLVAGTNITIDEDTNTISATGGGTTYTAGDNISIEDNVITAKGYTYDETTKQITAEGNIGCKITYNEQQVDITVQDIANSMMFKPNPTADPHNIAIFDENNSVMDSLHMIGGDTFAVSVMKWSNFDEGTFVFTEAVDMSSVTTYPNLYGDEKLTEALKASIKSYDATSNSITTSDGVFQFEYVIDLNAQTVATEKGVINYVADKIIADAPEDDKIYGRKNATWVEVESSSGTTNAYSKVTVGSTTATASGEDTLTIASGIGITASLDADTKTVTIKNDGVQSMSYSAGTYATVDGTTARVALYDTQKTDATGSDTIYIDNAKNSCTQVYIHPAGSTSVFATVNCYYALYKNDNTLISQNIENNKYKLCATGIMYFRNQNDNDLYVVLPTTLRANTSSALTTNLTPVNFYGSSEMIVPSGKTGILYIQINAIDDNFTDAIASIWGDVSIS